MFRALRSVAFEKLPVVAAVALALPATALADELPLRGDLENGARLYRLNCAACHGLGGMGDGPLAKGLATPPTNLRDGGYLWSRTEQQLLDAIAGSTLPEGSPPIHDRDMSLLDRLDIIAWLREPVPGVDAFFPNASDYIAHMHAIDQFGLERAENALGRALDQDERTWMILTAFKPAPGKSVPATGPRLIPEEPAELYEAKPRNKLGFVAFHTLELDGGRVPVAIALDREMRVKKVTSLPAGDVSSERLRKRIDPILASYAGAGGRVEKKPIAPQNRSVRATKDLQREMLRIYTITLEGAAMYEKEERDRFWADPEAYSFPEAADQPDNVKFEFREKRAK